MHNALRPTLIFLGAFAGGLVGAVLAVPHLANAQLRGGTPPGPAANVATVVDRVTVPAQGVVYVDGNGRELMRLRPNGALELTDATGRTTSITAGAVQLSRANGKTVDTTGVDADGLESQSQAVGGLGVGGPNANVVRAGATAKGAYKPGVTTVVSGRTWSTP